MPTDFLLPPGLDPESGHVTLSGTWRGADSGSVSYSAARMVRNGRVEAEWPTLPPEIPPTGLPSNCGLWRLWPDGRVTAEEPTPTCATEPKENA